jgi:hypothetical protein
MKPITKVFVILIVIFSGFAVFQQSNSKKTTLEDCQSLLKKDKNFISAEAEKLSLDCYVKVVSNEAGADTPSKALDYLFKYISATNKNNLNIDCHTIIHAVGYGFYDRFREDSLIPDKEYCNYGYYHGVFQRAIELKLNDYKKYMEIICENRKDDNLTFCKAAVSHGYGHSVASINPDHIQGFSICDQIIVQVESSIEEENCSYGYVMETIIDTEARFDPKYCLNASNSSLIRGCLTGVAYLMVRNGIEIAKGCPKDLFTPYEIQMCFRGYGYAVGETILNYEINKEENILALDKKLFADCVNIDFCLAGAGSMLGSYFLNNQERAEDLCRKYLPSDVITRGNGKEYNNTCITSVVRKYKK